MNGITEVLFFCLPANYTANRFFRLYIFINLCIYNDIDLGVVQTVVSNDCLRKYLVFLFAVMKFYFALFLVALVMMSTFSVEGRPGVIDRPDTEDHRDVEDHPDAKERPGAEDRPGAKNRVR